MGKQEFHPIGEVLCLVGAAALSGILMFAALRKQTYYEASQSPELIQAVYHNLPTDELTVNIYTVTYGGGSKAGVMCVLQKIHNLQIWADTIQDKNVREAYSYVLGNYERSAHECIEKIRDPKWSRSELDRAAEERRQRVEKLADTLPKPGHVDCDSVP